MTALATPNRWKFEIAAMLSQLACVTMVPETIDAIYTGKQLPAKEQALYNMHPSIASDLLKTIPRMESIAWMIAHQHKAITVDGDIRNREMAEMRLGPNSFRSLWPLTRSCAAAARAPRLPTKLRASILTWTHASSWLWWKLILMIVKRKSALAA